MATDNNSHTKVPEIIIEEPKRGGSKEETINEKQVCRFAVFGCDIEVSALKRFTK